MFFYERVVISIQLWPWSSRLRHEGRSIRRQTRIHPGLGFTSWWQA